MRGPKGKKPKQRYPRLGRGQIIPTAQALHRRMYAAFAEYVASFPPPFLSVLLVGSSLRQRIPEEIQDLTNKQAKMICNHFRKDIPTLSTICMEGLLSSFQTRIGLRPSGEVHEWTLHKYTHSPRIVSHRAALIQEGSIMRQAVVRIRSAQSLDKGTKNTKTKKKGEGEKDTAGIGEGKMMDEYVVIQKNIFQGVEDDWMVWGTTKESDVSEIIGR